MRKMTLASCFVLMAALCLNSAESWRFLPNFQCDVRGIEKASRIDADFFDRLPSAADKLLSADSPLTEKQRDELYWHPARFPHRDFVNLMPDRGVYGWYGCLFDIPEDLRGLDVLADLGIIDDTDEAFVNGVRIGGVGTVGQPHGTAWQTERLYRIPADGLAPHSNYMAVHVWSLWGLGGIVGPPVLKAAVAPPEAQWELAFAKDSAASPDGLNQLPDADSAVAAVSGGVALEWAKVPMPWQGFAAWHDDVHYAVFRLRFDMLLKDGTPRLPSSPVVMDVGAVFDVAAFYLNGRRVGLTGRFPENGEPAFTEAAQRGQFIVFPEDWSPDGHNDLIAVVYRERGVGGLPGVPGILLSTSLENGAALSFSEKSSLFTILLQSERFFDAERVLDTTGAESDTDRAWLLSHRAHLAFLKWLDGGRKDDALLDAVLAPVAEILAKYPAEAPKQSAMQAFCRVLRLAEKDERLMAKVRCIFPDFGKRCHFQGIDAATRGDWMLSYGTQGWLLPAMGQITDWKSPNVRLNSEATGNPRWPSTCSYALSIPGEKDFPRLWLAGSSRKVSGSSALLMPFPFLKQLEGLSKLSPENLKSPLFDGTALRRASWWDDHGEMHPFDDNGPDFNVLLNASAPIGRLALYFYDIDWSRTRHPRQESLMLFSSAGDLLNACWIGKMENGRYFRFVLSDASIRFRINKHRGACTSLSGIFLDGEKHWIEPDLEEYGQVCYAAESSQRSANMQTSRLLSAAVAGDVGNTARLADSACMLARKMSEIEYNGNYRITTADAAGMLRSLKTIGEVADALWCIDKCGRHGLFWKLGLLSRAFEIMESMRMEEMLQEADRLSAVLYSSSKDNWPFHKIIASYCRQKEAPENSAEVKRIDRRVPNWTQVQTTFKTKESDNHEKNN